MSLPNGPVAWAFRCCVARPSTGCAPGHSRLMRGFSGFDDEIRALGGIASRRELLRAGWTADELWFGQYYGHLRRLRRGWYGASDLAPAPAEAWRRGGPLACVSALYFLNERPGAADSGPLHVGLNRNGHLYGDPAGRLAVAHWSTPDAASGTRQCVSLDTAIRQARRCARRELGSPYDPCGPGASSTTARSRAA